MYIHTIKVLKANNKIKIKAIKPKSIHETSLSGDLWFVLSVCDQ